MDFDWEKEFSKKRKDSLDLFLGKTGSGDFHSEMNGDHYADYIKERLPPNLPDKTVLIIDKASFVFRLNLQEHIFD